MIGRLRGIILEKQPPEILLEVSGVGYELQLPMTCFYELPSLGEEVILYTHFVVREDAQLLYGFNNRRERSLFRELLKANGVGPKLALAILSGMSANQVVSAIEREDISSLIKLPGVGKKTAERLVVEMKDRLKGWSDGALFTPMTDAVGVAPGKTTALTRQTFVGKVMSLLLNMLSRLVITFLPRSKCLLISWLQSPSAVILEPKKIKSDTVSTVSPSISHELPDVQAGFRKGRGTRDQIANICWIMEKAREFQKNIYFCFTDYAKAFDCMDHNKLWKI